MTKFFRLISIGCALVLNYNLCFAEDWYQIEVIAFEYLHPNEDQVELWDNHPGEPNWKDGVNLTDEATARSRQKKQEAEKLAAAPAPTPEAKPEPTHEAPVQENGTGDDDEDDSTPHEPEAKPAPVKEAAQPEPAPKSDKQFVTVEEILTGHTDQASATPAGSNTPLAFVSLPSSLYTMGDIQRKLHKQGSYRVLTHTAWRQPAFTGNNEQGVHVFGGKLLDHEGPVGARYEFEGLISLRSSRYLHLDVDALLREAESKQSGGKFDSPADLGLLESKNHGQERMPIYQVYRLLQSQRVRSNKLYYYDHPLMGLIVKISPYGG